MVILYHCRAESKISRALKRPPSWGYCPTPRYRGTPPNPHGGHPRTPTGDTPEPPRGTPPNPHGGYPRTPTGDTPEPQKLRAYALAPPSWLASLCFTCGGFATGLPSGATAPNPTLFCALRIDFTEIERGHSVSGCPSVIRRGFLVCLRQVATEAHPARLRGVTFLRVPFPSIMLQPCTPDAAETIAFRSCRACQRSMKVVRLSLLARCRLHITLSADVLPLRGMARGLRVLAPPVRIRVQPPAPCVRIRVRSSPPFVGSEPARRLRHPVWAATPTARAYLRARVRSCPRPSAPPSSGRTRATSGALNYFGRTSKIIAKMGACEPSCSFSHFHNYF